MFPIIIISLSVFALLIFTVLKNPEIKINNKNISIPYWLSPVAGTIIIILSGLLPIKTIINSLTQSGNINPLKILVLFISMTCISIFLDEAGLFDYLANKASNQAKNNQVKLFIILYSLTSILTVFTSNDIIILTFTPFICYFARDAKINPIPYLFGEFVAANTFSMMLIIGNPTNIYLASFAGIDFGSYLVTMFIPTVLSGIAALILLLVIFKKQLKMPISAPLQKRQLENKGFVIIGSIHLILCTILLVISSYIGLEMWYITLGFALSLFLFAFIFKCIHKDNNKFISNTIKRAPFELIPFVLSMFVIVLGLDYYNVTSKICEILGQGFIIFKYGFASFLSANIMNNIPMSVAFSSITSHLNKNVILQGLYASIIGSNIGAYFTPLGALAGIMWAGILKKMNIDFSFKKYIYYGSMISIPVLIVALLGLYISFKLLALI